MAREESWHHTSFRHVNGIDSSSLALLGMTGNRRQSRILSGNNCPVSSSTGTTQRYGTRSTMSKQYYVYILSSYTRVIYTGVTNDLCRRIYEHKHKVHDGFTSKYNVNQLGYYEVTNDIRAAIEREKQIKEYRREKKVALIEQRNPKWIDLSIELCGDIDG
jgi:putative endonuclease